MRNKFLQIIFSLSTILLISFNECIGANGVSDFSSGSKAFAMGRSATISFSDIFGTLYFPAGMTTSEKYTSSFLYAEPFEKTRSLRFGLSIPMKHNGAIGISYFNSKLDDLDQSDINNEKFGSYSYTQEEFILSYGNNLLNKMLYGLNLKWLKDNMSSSSESFLIQNNICIDMSFGYTPKFNTHLFKEVAFGITLGNFIQINDRGDRIPKHIRIIAENKHKLENHSFFLVLNQLWYQDVSFDYQSRFHLGFEYGYNIVFLRFGYNSDFVSIGAGLEYSFFAFDYGYGSITDSYNSSHSMHSLTLTAKL